MTHRILFEDAGWQNLLPLVYWRSISELRCGRRLLFEQHILPPLGGRAGERGSSAQGEGIALWVRPALADVTRERHPQFSVNAPVDPEARTVLLINARWLAEESPPADGPTEAGICQGQIAYLRLPAEAARELDARRLLVSGALAAQDWITRLGRGEQAGGVMVNYPWDLVVNNVQRMLRDWRLEVPSPCPSPGGGGNKAAPLSPTLPPRGGKIYDGVYLLDEKNIRIGAGSSVKPCTVLDAEDGPIWIGQNVRISPHCTIQGPVAICDGTLVQPGAVIRAGTTIGPVCKVGGEIEDSILWGYSNKQHDGFLGHAILGSWINIAADSINSDLKNTYGPIRVAINGVEVDSGQMFVGLTMGDHTKSGINSSFATGTVVGFCSNVICNAFPPKFVPSFCWLTDAARKKYDPARGLAVARTVMGRRKMKMTAAEEA
ncbi:MAG: putative sugar nucleotidyl transferase, partial [Phycisphaerae bacterium]|nr:putative sugar nucleotidyl transferase [Phycisphaerae bacterium]